MYHFKQLWKGFEGQTKFRVMLIDTLRVLITKLVNIKVKLPEGIITELLTDE